jgi:hypothetical protein
MNKSCIFYISKVCTNCGECDVCDLNSSKKCDNCGKCINMDNLDMKAVNIDEIQEDDVECNGNETEGLYSEEVYKTSSEGYLISEDIEFSENLESWDLIDDIEGINEVLNDKETFKDRAVELFPGLIVIKD